MKTIVIESADEYQYMRENYIGLCIHCQASQDSCEPDAENYRCEECGQNAVYGIENLMIMGLLKIEGDYENL